jgi:hypothetical protein
MTLRSLIAGIIVLAIALPASAQLDRIFKGLGLGGESGLSDAKIGSGLKEALKIGTENTEISEKVLEGQGRWISKPSERGHLI